MRFNATFPEFGMRAFLTTGAFLLLTGTATAQPRPDPADIPAMRYELGQRLKRFEVTWEKHTNPQARWRALTHVEKLTQQFFSFQFGEVGRGLDRAGFALLTEDDPAASWQWAWSLYAVPEARVVDGSAKELTVTIKQLYTVKGDVPKGLEVQLWFTDKQITTLKPNKFPVTVKVPLPPLGDFKGLDRKLYFMVEAGKELRYTAIGISQVADLKPRLAALKKTVAGWGKVDSIEKATARERSKLLADLASGTVPETDLPAANLLANAEAMVDGKPFYTATKVGQFWLSVPTSAKTATATRIYVPRGLDAKKPVPVVVALHGAGGSENLFFEGYGGGRIVTECRKRGWMLIAPRSGLAFGSAPPVPAILDELAKRYPIDLKRVFVVGHSMGAMQTVALVQQYPAKFAAVAALGGGGTVRDAKAFTELPFFLGVGEKDTIALSSARGLNKSLTNAGAKKLTYKEYPHIEHMVIVREALPDVFVLFDRIAEK
jgi:predicted esterase